MSFCTGYLSPPKKPSTLATPRSPFCTSPSQLQEVTLDQDATCFSNTMGLRSPGGLMRGHSVRDFEEQLTGLKKENFNLKLRIYFLEEKMGTNFTLDRDNVIKKNIEFQVELANLQKEVQEKNELLCQAVKAMELEDDEHKKCLASKEEQLNMCQQELDDLRAQLQDVQFVSNGRSKSASSTKATSSGQLIAELQEKIKTLETEREKEKDGNASVQFVLAQAETLKHRYENMQKEFRAKEEVVKSLHEEIESANAKVMSYCDQLREFQEKLDASNKENQSLHKKIQSDTKKFDEIAEQMADTKKRYSTAKVELEREHKKLERLKLSADVKIAELEQANDKLKSKGRDLEKKLNNATLELRKNQNIAVAQSPTQKSSTPNTYDDSVSVQDAATPSRTPKKDSQRLQVSTSTVASLPPSPSSTLAEAGKLGAGEQPPPDADKILSQYQLMKSENAAQKQKIIKLKGEQMKACEIIKGMIESRNKANEDISQLKGHVKRLEHELESVVTRPTGEEGKAKLQERVASLNIQAVNAGDENSMAGSQNADLEIAEHYKALTEELEAKIEILVATLTEKDAQMQKIREQYDEILTCLEDKENRIVDLEFELMSSRPNSKSASQSFTEKGDTSTEKRSSFYRQEIEEKDKEIERLTVELKKCTCYLQEIVNKELWDKNKEIEKMHNKQANSPEIIKLRKDLTGKDMQLKVLKDKISELGLDIDVANEDSCEIKDSPASSKNINHIRSLKEQLKLYKEERDYFKGKLEESEAMNLREAVKKLQEENQSLGSEIEKSEKLRHESNEVCALLNARLEELAIFLDSLLKQKSVLGLLGIHKEQKLREIVSNSLDLSKSFAMSILANPDQSLAQLSNITTLLNGSIFQELTVDNLQEDDDESQAVLSIVPTNITLTYQSHLYKQNKRSEPNNEELISALREQIVNLKSELQLRDNELNRINTLYNKELSEKSTETDDEPSRKSLSKLFNAPVKCNTSTTLKCQSDVLSESESWSEPDRYVSRARIGLSQTLPTRSKENKERIFSDSTEESRNSTTPTKKRQNVIELHQQIAELHEEVKIKTELVQTLDETEEKLKNAETKLMEAETRIDALTETVQELNRCKERLEETMTVKDKETQNAINQLEVDKEEALRTASQYECAANEAKQEIEETKTKLLRAQEEMYELEEKLKKEFELFAANKLRDAEEEFSSSLQRVEHDAEEKIKQIQDDYCRNYVKKSDVELKLKEVERLISEMDDLKNIVSSYEQTIEAYKAKEREVGNKLNESQDKINSLRIELDMTTLQYSEAVLEKTKMATEKSALEQELNKYSVRDMELKQQIGDIRTELGAVNQSYQKQVAALQQQKSKLEVKLSEVESANAELHNKLVRLQASCGSDFNLSMPNIGSKNVMPVPYRRQFSDQNYSSEENVDERRRAYNVGRPVHQNGQPVVDVDRREANSSPDLGIESDHGRFSSLETHLNVQRPLLQTIELTESMSNLLDGDNNPIRSVACEGEHCCQTTMEIVHENNDLKRKLLRMRRALEETANQLNLANQRKKQVEKTICKQIHKTSQVLRKAKANLDSGSESDMLNKM